MKIRKLTQLKDFNSVLFLSFTVFICILMYPAHVAAQCKVKTDVMPGTNQEVKISKKIAYGGGWNDRLEYHVIKVDTIYLISASFSREQSKDFNIGKSCPLVMLLENDGSIALYPNEDVISNTQWAAMLISPLFGFSKKTTNLYYSITPDQIIQLGAEATGVAKVYYTSEKQLNYSDKDDLGTYFTVKMNKGITRNLYNDFKCVITEN